MESKPPLQAKPLRRKVHVVYYLSRGGQLDHPHLLEGYLTSAQDGLRLRDFKRWLAVLRGKSMPSSFAWSYKRNYKNGFIWHDLGDNDLIQPLSKNEYVLMGSEIRDIEAVGKCKCGGVQQTERTEMQEEPLNKPSNTLKSPRLLARSNSNVDDRTSLDGGRKPNVYINSGSSVSSEISNYHDNNKTINKGTISRGGSSRSFELTAQKLLEEVKRPTAYHDTSSTIAKQKYELRGRAVLIRDCEIEDEHQEGIMELASNDQAPYEAERQRSKGNNSPYIKQATSIYKSRGDYCDGIDEDLINGDHDINGINIMDAATQTGDSTRCSTDHQENMNASYNDMKELVGSPAVKFSSAGTYNGSGSLIKRSSSNLGQGGVIRSSLSKQLSKEFSNLPDVQKDIMINNSSELADQNPPANLPSSNTSLQNHMASPALSSCSAISTRSTRFAREDSNRPAHNYSAKYGKPDHQHHNHSKGSSNTTTTSSTLLKQILSCGNADVVRETKPSNEQVIMSSNALSGIQTPGRVISTGTYQAGVINSHDKKGGSSNGWICKPGLMKRISTSSDNRSVISATVSDTLELVSSPESVYSSRHIKSIMRANSLSSHAVNLVSSASHDQQHLMISTAAAAPPGSISPGVLSVGSSTSRRSSIRESDPNVSGGDVEQGLREALRSHHVAMSASPKIKANKGNKNNVSMSGKNDVEVAHDNENLELDSNNIMQSMRGGKLNSASVSELHKLICNPSGTPTCNINKNHKVITANFTTMSLQHTPTHHHYHHHPDHDNKRDSHPPQHYQSHHILISPHGPTRTPIRSSNLNSPGVNMSKSLNSPSSALFLEEISRQPPSSSSYVTTWKDLLWSPRYTSSHKEKDKRHMKP